MNLVNVAIDGPAGAGKSTIAKLVAKQLNYIYVDTGAMYRAVGYFVLQQLQVSDDQASVLTDDSIDQILDNQLADVSIDIEYLNEEQQIILNDVNVSSDIRTAAMGIMASRVSARLEVRQYLVKLQQAMAKRQPVVMDGRDIGTHVLPHAKLKIYLTASVDIRAERRMNQLIQAGEKADLEQLKHEIEARDYADMNREHAPLRQAKDAVLLDSSHMTIEAVVDYITKLAQEKINGNHRS
jgi:cytidylate kinase